MRAGGRILMIFGVVLGIIAAAATFIILRATAPAEDAGTLVDTATVMIALQPIDPWQSIPVDAVSPREYPLPIPDDAVLAEMEVETETGETETVSGQEFIQGKISNTRIYPGQVIVTTQLVEKELEEQRLGIGSNVSYIIPDGQYAMAIPVDNFSNIAGGLEAGDQVDVLTTFNISVVDPATGEVQTTTITQLTLQRIPVLRVGPWRVTEDGDEGGGGDVVTLLLEPQQALELKFMQDTAIFTLALRSITDEQDFTTDPVELPYMDEQYNLLP